MTAHKLARRLALMEWVEWKHTTPGAKADYLARARKLLA
jgi:hypothetical protein